MNGVKADKSRHNICGLSTGQKSGNRNEAKLCTDLSTLSTNFAVEKMVYIVFFRNRRFVDCDKIKEKKKKFRKGVDREAYSILNKITEYSEYICEKVQLKAGNLRFSGYPASRKRPPGRPTM